MGSSSSSWERFKRPGRILVIGLLVGVLAAGCGEEPAASARIERVLPAETEPGRPVSLYGQDLGSEGSITVAGIPAAKVVSWTSSRIEFQVPPAAPIGPTQIQITIGGTPMAPLPFKVRAPLPTPESVEPSSGKRGDWVTIRGQNLGSGKAGSKVRFGDADVTEIKEWTDKAIAFRVPAEGKGSRIVVTIHDQESADLAFRLVTPRVASVAPPAALPGAEMTLSGRDFTDQAGEVLFAGLQNQGKVLEWTDDTIRVQAPGKLSPGSVKIRVRNANGISLPVEFSCQAQPPDMEVARVVEESKFAALLLDEKDFPHFVFYDNVMRSPVYWWWAGLDWGRNVGTIPRAPDAEIIETVGWYPAIDRDRSGNLHIAHYDLFNKKLWYGVFDVEKAAWTYTNPDAKGLNEGMTSSIRVRDDGEVFIAYFVQTTGELRVARGKGTSFEVIKVDGSSPSPAGLTPCLRLDGKGHPHITYLDYQNKDLKYAWWDEAKKAFVTETVDDKGFAGEAPSMEFDAAGTLHVAYYQRAAPDQPGALDGLRYAVRKDGAWTTTVVEEGKGVGFLPQLQIDPKGRIHIVTMSREDSALHYALGEGGTFKIGNHPIENLSATDEPGNLAMALGRDGTARVIHWLDKPRRVALKNLKAPG